jgi:hypothetical protein
MKSILRIPAYGMVTSSGRILRRAGEAGARTATVRSAVVLPLLLAIGATMSPFEGVVTVNWYQAGAVWQQVRYTYRGQRIRSDMESGPRAGTWTLMDRGAGTGYAVVPQQQMALELDLKGMETMAKQSGLGTPTPASARRATGQKLRIAGRECEVHQIDGSPEPVEICYAAPLGFGFPGTTSQDLTPLRMRVQRGGAWSTVWEVVRIEPGTVPPSQVALPSGYQIKRPFAP